VKLRAQDYLAIQGYRLQRKLRHLSRKIYLWWRFSSLFREPRLRWEEAIYAACQRPL
jgi:hypothetical protein